MINLEIDIYNRIQSFVQRRKINPEIELIHDVEEIENSHELELVRDDEQSKFLMLINSGGEYIDFIA